MFLELGSLLTDPRPAYCLCRSASYILGAGQHILGAVTQQPIHIGLAKIPMARSLGRFSSFCLTARPIYLYTHRIAKIFRRVCDQRRHVIH
jgi:hypothetical protein